MAIDLNKKLTEEELIALVLHKFYKNQVFRSYHIYESDIAKGFPSHIRNQMMRVTKELRRKGYLVAFPHGRELVWQLNMQLLDDVKILLKKYYSKEFEKDSQDV